MKNRLYIYCVLITMAFFCGGCSKTFPSNYSLGVIYSTAERNKSKISYYDENLNEITSITYPYGHMGHYGFMNANILDDVLYEAPLGRATKKDLGLIIGLEVNSGKIAEYDFDRVNITDFVCDEKYIYATSNLDGISYIDRYDRANGDIASIEVESYYVADLALNEGILYGFGMGSDTDLEKEITSLHRFDFESKEIEDLYNFAKILEESPSYSIFREGTLYFVENKYLFSYNIKDNELDKISLTHGDGFNLVLNGNDLYVGCTDIFNGSESWIDVVDLEKGKVTGAYQVDSVILQMEILDNNIFIWCDDRITEYRISGDELIKARDIEVNWEGDYYVGGFFVKEGEER